MSRRTPVLLAPRPSGRRLPARAVLSLLATVSFSALLVGCSSDQEGSPPSTTTGIATTLPLPSTTAPSSGGAPSDALPGLWVVGPTGLADETGEVWASAAAGEILRSPMSGPAGGVAFLRCSGEAPTCSVQLVTAPGSAPKDFGPADELLAAGTFGDRPVLVIGATDPTIVPSFEENRSSKIGRLVDVDNAVVTPIAGWYGWESGPFVVAISPERVIACVGEGETCSLAAGPTPDALVPLDGVGEPATVLSVALDESGDRLTWATATPMTGAVSVHVADLVGAASAATQVEVRPSSEPPPDDIVTDGAWVAVRSGGTVQLSQLAPEGPAELTGNTGTRTVPADTTEIAVRELGGGGSGPALAL